MSTPSTVERGTIYTLGYRQRKAAAILERPLRQPQALLLDVRYQPACSFNPGWDPATLAARYGEQYRWGRRLGTASYLRREPPIRLPARFSDECRQRTRPHC